MSSADEYQVKNVYKYSRKSYKKNRKNMEDGSSPRENSAEVVNFNMSHNMLSSQPACSCEPDTEADIAQILHKKCPVISLAQEQLQRLVEGTDKLLCDNSTDCKSLSDFICICRNLLNKHQNRAQYALMLLIILAFFIGMLLGSATCGSYLGRFNSPILTCIDNLFLSDSYNSLQDSFHSIA